jgi:hypothetical protein
LKIDFTTFDDGETIEDYTMCLSNMAAHLSTLNEEVKDGEIIVKMLQSLLPRFKHITIKTLLNVSTMSIADLTKQLKEAEEAFEEASMLLQQDRKLYLTEEEWDTQRKKSEAENHSGGSVSKGHGHDCSSSGRPSNKPTSDKCRHCGKMGIGHMSVAQSPRRSMCMSHKTSRRDRSS